MFSKVMIGNSVEPSMNHICELILNCVQDTSKTSTHKPNAPMAEDTTATAMEDQQESLERSLADERSLRSFTEQVLDCRQIELEVAEAENKKLLKKIDQLTRELSESKAQLLEAQAQVKSKDRNLQEAGDQIFRLQSQREDITESEARDAYKALCDKIQRWVENKLPITLEAVSSGQIKKPPPAQATKFLSLLREPAKRCLSVHLSDEYHVVAAIMYYLWLAFFSKPFYCPLDDSTEDATLLWLLGIESAMAKSRSRINHNILGGGYLVLLTGRSQMPSNAANGEAKPCWR